ncbi:5044_t:CDS:2 [Dentiscutata heterogama]|uniref:5044_t:CDS:1 n=1 Tax=Dentiscutata heterogama TaxID=1316150 RepID=A0ACA9KSU8_9GLOM|nr:5044_t:CDS:2 [Dentiscutata heterogama]
MDQMFAPEYFETIFRFLPTNKDLHSCLLVNKYWATCAVPILWEAPFKINDNFTPSPKVIQTYLAFIPDETFLKLGYDERIGLSITKPPFFDYPSFLKELPYDRFLNSAIANDCCKNVIIELLKIFAMNMMRLRRFNIYDYLFNQHFKSQDQIASSVLPYFSECTLIFSNLTYLDCSYQWPMKKDQLFNAITQDCHSIETLKVSVWHEDEGKVLADLIRSQKHLKKFSLINSNNFASPPVQALMKQKHSLNSVTFKDIHSNHELSEAEFFNYTICELNSDAIDVLAQCTNINKIKFKHCEGLNSPLFLPITSTFSNLTSLEYSYGTYNIHDVTTPIKLLSGLIRKSCNTLKRVTLDWHSRNYLDITQLIKAITQPMIRLKYLKIPLYTLEQLALIHQTHNHLKKLEVHVNNRINPFCALSIFANVPFKSPEQSIKLYFDYNQNSSLKANRLNHVFESIFYKSNRISDFILYGI